MCRERPGHDNLDVIASKIWLIGRAYAASLERGSRSNQMGSEDFFYKIVAPAVRDSKIDKWIADTRSIRRLTPESVSQSLECHKRVMSLFSRITGKLNRSFTSKYLHFHVPDAFFIFDSRASAEISERTRHQKFVVPCGYDDQYASFAIRCLAVRDRLEDELGHPVTPRFLDMHLLRYWPAGS